LTRDATKFDRSRALGSQNGEQLGLAAPELVALPCKIGAKVVSHGHYVTLLTRIMRESWRM
jgi:hypothetical protein